MRVWLDQTWINCGSKSRYVRVYRDTVTNPNSWKDSCLLVYRKQVILAWKEDAPPGPPFQLSGCKGVRKVSGQRTRWPGSVLLQSVRTQGLPSMSSHSLFVLKMCVWLNRKWGRRTCLSPRTSSRLSVSSRLHCTGCVTHTFHIPVDVSGRPVRQLIVTHAS